MKRIVLIVMMLINVFTFTASASHSKNSHILAGDEFILNESGGTTTQVINALDSVFFDLSTATIIGNTVEFPVYLRSDDVINALDFAFKYDQTKLEYDTILNMTNYIDALSFYNTFDSTVRLTSYSFSQPYPNDSILFKIKFTVLSGQICSGDLNTVSALLNGDACSHKVVECLNSGINDLDQGMSLALYPNPAHDYVIIEAFEMTKIDFIDVAGKVIFQLTETNNEEKIQVDITSLPSGIYFIRRVIGSEITMSKLVVK